MDKNRYGRVYGRLSRLPRRVKRLIMVSADAAMLPLALWAAVALRLGEVFPSVGRFWWLFVVVPLLSIPAFATVGLYRAVIRYMGPQAVFAVLKGVTISTLILAFFAILNGQPSGVPRSSIILYWLIALVAIGGSRFLVRAYFQAVARQRMNKERVLIYGAGFAGVQLATALASGDDYDPVAFVDDDPNLHRSVIGGIKVYPSSRLASLLDSLAISQVLLAVPSMSRTRRREIIDQLEALHVPVKTLPSMSDLISGTGRLDEVREVDIEDLLGRDPVAADQTLLDACIRGKSVMVTGAGGSIGSELCRQIVRLGPRAAGSHGAVRVWPLSHRAGASGRGGEGRPVGRGHSAAGFGDPPKPSATGYEGVRG